MKARHNSLYIGFVNFIEYEVEQAAVCAAPPGACEAGAAHTAVTPLCNTGGILQKRSGGRA